jgi:hypothetical protein
MVIVTCNAAIAIATRNATFKVIPRALVDEVWNHARHVAKGDIKTLPERIHAALAYFAKKGVHSAEVFKALDVPGIADISLDDLETLQGYWVSVEEGHATVDEIFRPAPTSAPRTPDRQPGESNKDALKRRLRREPEPIDAPPPAARRPETPEEETYDVHDYGGEEGESFNR